MMGNEELVPQELRDLDQWVLWKIMEREGNETKVPCQANGSLAKSNDSSTWSDFGSICAAFTPEFEGIGFVFSADDPFCGIDLDGCRDPETGVVAEWARAIILKLSSYSEVSPSKTGVKIWVRAIWKFTQHKIAVEGVPTVCEKLPAIEIYDRVRYFAVTGNRLQGMRTIESRQTEVDALHNQFWGAAVPPSASLDFRSASSVCSRARSYLLKLPHSVSGQGGHNRAFHAACILVHGFGLSCDDAFGLMSEWNSGCQPPWSEKELRHKVESAESKSGERNYLRNVEPKNFDKVPVPEYKAPPPPPKSTTLKDAAEKYFESVRAGSNNLIDTGIPELDHAIGGGVESGELVLLAGRPSHGKSAIALQMIHHWTRGGMPVVFISEEMSALALGKRVVQFATDIHQEHWLVREDEVADQIGKHFHDRAACRIIESCRTSEVAAQAIRLAVQEIGAKCAVVDYAQLLESKGRSRYEQVTQTSIALRQIANENRIVVLALCQVSREIEKRDTFVPRSSDLKETGQLEQDADVVIFGVWPHRIDQEKDPHEYQFFVAKNRNRAINRPAFSCRFEPSRQRFLDEAAKHQMPVFDSDGF